MKFKALFTAAVAASAMTAGTQAQAASRDYISIVGSSTVYPFATVVAERFGRSTEFSVPKIESTGSGGGLKLFCEGLGENTPDITNASRQIKSSEIELCASNGIDEIIEVKIGYDGIAFANAKDAEHLEISRAQLFMALAKDLPDASGELKPNPYNKWSDIDPSLPNYEIEVLGPPPTSGTRDAFVELVMEEGCEAVPAVAALEEKDEDVFEAVCKSMREDGRFIEAGENDNLIVQKLVASPEAFGIFGFGFLEENADKVQAAHIGGVEPTFDTIGDGSYPVSRSLFFYVKKAHVDVIPGMAEYLAEFTSQDAIGEFGYLTDRGLIPLGQREWSAVRNAVVNLEPNL